MDINNFIRQHKDILSDINEIDKIVSKQDYEEHLSEFVSHINSLAGKLKIHLSYEDKFLYPNLINGEDTELKNMAEEYMREMGDIADVFTAYKNEFNTRSKINERLDTFKVDTKRILAEIKNRILKEENGLYKVIVEKEIWWNMESQAINIAN